MILKQFYLGCLAHASYLIGDAATGTAVVVDPQRDVEQYLQEARSHGLQIRHVFLTHFHADFIAGHLELRDRVGAKIYLGAKAKAEYAFTAMKDGDTLEFGDVRLKTLETPGHTVESISILVYDLATSDSIPAAVLTGDTLFVGDVGRPDLRASLGWSASSLGEMLYESLRTKILALPDSSLVYPAHGAGSLCGRNISSETFSTIGEQRRTNYALQPMTRDEFVRLVIADQPEAPPYFTYDAILNSKEHPTLEQVLERELVALSLAELLEWREKGAQVLDCREPSEFANAHLIGSLNIGLGGQYASWAGTILDRGQPIAIIAGPGRQEEAATRLGRIGFDSVVGYLKDGMSALASRPDLLEPTQRIGVQALAGELSSPRPPLVLDVRRPSEWAEGHMDGSVNIPLNQLLERRSELPRDARVRVLCASGYRASIASSLLLRNGFADVADLIGGMEAWEAAHMPRAGVTT